MAVKVDCAWARVCVNETKRLCSIKRNADEGTAKFRARVFDKRYKIFSEHFNEYPHLHISKPDFNRVQKVIDDTIGNWRNKSEKEAYLKEFSINNWDEGKVITKAGKKEHSLTNCKACSLFHSHLQSTFPMKKQCRVPGSKGPLSDLKANAKRQATCSHKDPKITNKKLKLVGQAIYDTYNEKCKENFDKSLSDILVLVPEAGLQKKLSPAEKQKMKRDQQRETKRDLEAKMSRNDTALHLSIRESYSSRQVQRMAQSFETIEEAKERARKTPPKVKERSHTASAENIDGELDQLLADVESWPDGTINWSEKARIYKIRTKGTHSTPGNGGQIIKSFLQSKQIDIARFESHPPRELHSEDLTGTKAILLKFSLKQQTSPRGL